MGSFYLTSFSGLSLAWALTVVAKWPIPLFHSSFDTSGHGHTNELPTFRCVSHRTVKYRAKRLSTPHILIPGYDPSCLPDNRRVFHYFPLSANCIIVLFWFHIIWFYAICRQLDFYRILDTGFQADKKSLPEVQRNDNYDPVAVWNYIKFNAFRL